MTLPALLLAAALAPAWAQVQVNAEADKTEVPLDGQIQLTVTVSGPQASLPDPRLPPLPNFSVYSSGRSQNISFVNGKLSSSVVHTFVLVPRFVGRGTIDPISVEGPGGTAKTAPIEIQVHRPGTAPGPAPGRAPSPPAGRGAPPAGGEGRIELFVNAELDKKTAFVNEPVVLSVRFFTSVNLLGNPQYQPPRIAGFLAEDLPPERHGNVVVKGRTYYYSEIKTVLFPAQAGRLTVGPATVRAQVQKDVAVDPFAADFFDRFFAGGMGGAETRDLRSEPLVLTAEALPEKGKPEGFSGAVGQFSIAAAVDRARVKAGEAVSLTVTVSGKGNLKAISDPVMPSLNDFRSYETVTTLNLDKKGDEVRGSKVFRTVLVPRVSGDLRIPPVTFSYFDPAARAYRTAASLPLTVKADPGEAGAQAPQAGPVGAPGPAPRGLTAVSSDIRYLKPAGGASRVSRALAAAGKAGPWHAVPFLALAWALGLARYEEAQANDPAGRRRRAARREAAARARRARAAADASARAALLSEALTRYLADRLGEPPAGLTLRRALELMRARPAPPEARTLEEIRSLWEQLDRLRFAPPSASGGPDGAALADGLEGLLDRLEKELSR